jgi:putative ABC transport system permease protein
MIRNILLTAFRSLRKNAFFSALNITGLAIGMTVFLLIAQYVHFEKSFESFIPANENIYRVTLQTYSANTLTMASAENYPGVGPAMKSEFPEVADFARLYNMGYKNNVVITYKDAKPVPVALKQHHFLYADSSFLPMMNYKMVKGVAVSALATPLTAVISEDYSRIYFKNEEPIGKTLLMQDDDANYELVTITGVFKNLPANTHLKFDILFSYKTLYTRGENAIKRYDKSWSRKDMYTFVKLHAGADPENLQAKLPALVDKFKPELKQSQEKNVLRLQPIKDIHLQSELTEEAEANGSDRIVLFMAIIGIFVLVIAWINYINLSTARAVERAKEVGVRKVIGAPKKQLVLQFLAEAALVNLFSVMLAWGFVAISLPWFNTLSELSLSRAYLVQTWFLLLVLILWGAGTLLSGIYPALVLSSFKPLVALKGKMKNNLHGIALRKGLVVMQFMVSIIFIAGTIVVYRQLDFMMKRDLGLNIDQVLVVQRPGIAETDGLKFNAAIDVFRNELKKNPAIEAVSASMTVPGKQREYKGIIKRFGSSTNDSATLRINTMDDEFIDVFKMKLLAGREFSRDHISDEDSAVILTESASRLLGFKTPEDAIGKILQVPIFNDDAKPLIVGVVNDYHQLSLKKTLEPTLFLSTMYHGEYYSVRIKTTNLSPAVDHIRGSWTKAFPGNPFDYFFLDDYFNRQYSNERKFGKLFTTFAILAITIGCVGLFGLSSYMASQRSKEISIRKVLGASVTNISMKLSKNFLKLIIISIMIATPISWLVMDKWLQDFAYRIKIDWWIFAVAGLMALLIALLTVSYQAVKAALANPAKNLRSE